MLIKFSFRLNLILQRGLPLALIFFSAASFAQDSATLSDIVVRASEDDGLKKYEINRIETLKINDLKKKSPQTFAQAIDDERGIDVETSCAFCGAKRITINGMKGEHTTILVDGLSLHSTVSGFYGVEAIPLTYIDSIDVYRGSGAALRAPESIGGAINIITKEIATDQISFDSSYTSDRQYYFSVLGTKKIGTRTGALLGGQLGEVTPLDDDENGIAEIPRQNTRSFVSKFTRQMNDRDELSLRFSYADLSTIGGTTRKNKLSGPIAATATSDDFVDRDVRKKYIGDEDKITDNVDLSRVEAASAYKYHLNADSNFKVSLGLALQDQKAIYSHGYDYDNKDRLIVGMLEHNRVLSESHLLTIGLDTKNQKMDSSSERLYQNPSAPLPEDDLTYISYGGFIQDTWTISERSELASAVRVDQIKTRWIDMNREIDRLVVAPRLMFKHAHDPVFTSRAALGLGYRSPLTLFESQHGTDHNGFILEVDKLETAQSFVYSLAGQWMDDFFEFGTHLTRIENMAYGVDRANTGDPTVFRNSATPYLVSVFDISYGHRFGHGWTVEGLIEFFNMPSGYKEKLPVAATESRLSITSNVELGKWKLAQKLTGLGPRDLSKYGYFRHYNVAYTDQDITSPTFGRTVASDQKWQRSPLFFTLDLYFERAINDSFAAVFSVLNAFDYTQTKAGDSPTTWHLHGDHYHLDNFHIWGPLRGRQFVLSIKGSF